VDNAPPNAGLCARCVHAKLITNRRGSVFLLCHLSMVDPAFPKYPGLPVLRCRGFREAVRSEGPPIG
jgi:hypothetical protein